MREYMKIKIKIKSKEQTLEGIYLQSNIVGHSQHVRTVQCSTYLWHLCSPAPSPFLGLIFYSEIAETKVR